MAFLASASGDSGAVPPDTQVAAGVDPGTGIKYLYEAVNDNIWIWTAGTPPTLVFQTDLFSFFQLLFSDVVSDPRIRFDPNSKRWFVSAVTIESLLGAGDWRLAVSNTSDPTGTYTLYAATTNGSFPDFPKLAVTEDKVVLTENAFTILTQRFQGTEFLVVSKADVVAGASNPADKFFPPSQGSFTIEPASSLSSTLYMAGAVAARKGTTMTIWTINGLPPSNLAISTKNLSIASLSTPPNAVQEGSSTLIATNDSRLLDAVYFVDSSGVPRLWVTANTGCVPPGDTATRACMRFTQVNLNSLSVAQDFNLAEPHRYYYFPSIAVDSGNNLLAVFNRSSSVEYPSIYSSGQKLADGAGTFRTPSLIWASGTPYIPSSSTFNRWGDYSGIGLDPSGTSVWIAGEYAHSSANDDWGTWIAQVQF